MNKSVSTANSIPLDEAEIASRKAFFGFEQEDADYLKSLHDPFVQNLQQRFTDAFYAHLQNFDELNELLVDEKTVQRLKQTQSEYFNSLIAGDYGVGKKSSSGSDRVLISIEVPVSQE